MSISLGEGTVPAILGVSVTAHAVKADLSDGRSIIVPIGWYPRLAAATAAERGNWRLIAKGRGVHWVDLDEDLSVENLLLGKASGESQASFQKWLSCRRRPSTSRTKRSAASAH